MSTVRMLMSSTSATMRKVALLLGATQIMLGSAPLTETAGRAVAHVEATGIDLHSAHSEETCIACVSLKLFDGAAPSHGAPPAMLVKAANPGSADDFGWRLRTKSPVQSRAPPR